MLLNKDEREICILTDCKPVKTVQGQLQIRRDQKAPERKACVCMIIFNGACEGECGCERVRYASGDDAAAAICSGQTRGVGCWTGTEMETSLARP
jgi:hypothetical protein